MININSRNGIDFLLCKRKWGDSWLILFKREIEIETALKNKIEFICSFYKTIPTIYNESVRITEHTNIFYVKPHRIEIKVITYLALNYETDIDN